MGDIIETHRVVPYAADAFAEELHVACYPVELGPSLVALYLQVSERDLRPVNPLLATISEKRSDSIDQEKIHVQKGAHAC